MKKVEEIVESIIERMTNYSFTYKLNNRYPGFDEDLKTHVADLRDFKITFEKAEKEKDVLQIQTLQEKILTLKAKIDKSFCFISFSTFLVHRNETLKSRGDDELMFDQINFKDMFDKNKEKLRKEMEKYNRKKIIEFICIILNAIKYFIYWLNLNVRNIYLILNKAFQYCILKMLILLIFSWRQDGDEIWWR